MKPPDFFVFTQSNLQDFVDCPYRFYLRHFKKIKWPAQTVGDAAEFEQRGQIGARFHRLVQQYLLEVPENRLSEIAQTDPSPKVLQWWESFLNFVPPWLTGEKFIESNFSTFFDHYQLMAKYDLVLFNPPDEVIIFDWKTSTKKPRKELLAARIQTRLYQFILADIKVNNPISAPIKPERIIMKYWFAEHPESPVALTYSNSMYEKDTVFFDNLINEIINKAPEEFIRTEDVSHCRYCVYRSHCDRGVDAGDLTEFDDFMAESEDLNLDIEFENISEIAF